MTCLIITSLLDKKIVQPMFWGKQKVCFNDGILILIVLDDILIALEYKKSCIHLKKYMMRMNITVRAVL